MWNRTQLARMDLRSSGGLCNDQRAICLLIRTSVDKAIAKTAT
jgi:hypothetical protein